MRTCPQNIVFHLPEVKQNAMNAKSPEECSQMFFDSNIIELFVINTNLYIDKMKPKQEIYTLTLLIYEHKMYQAWKYFG